MENTIFLEQDLFVVTYGHTVLITNTFYIFILYKQVFRYKLNYYLISKRKYFILQTINLIETVMFQYYENKCRPTNSQTGMGEKILLLRIGIL